MVRICNFCWCNTLKSFYLWHLNVPNALLEWPNMQHKERQACRWHECIKETQCRLLWCFWYMPYRLAHIPTVTAPSTNLFRHFVLLPGAALEGGCFRSRPSHHCSHWMLYRVWFTENEFFSKMRLDMKCTCCFQMTEHKNKSLCSSWNMARMSP